MSMIMANICQKCGKDYTHRQSLWNHKRNCKGDSKSDTFKKISGMFWEPDTFKKISAMSGIMEPPTKKSKKPAGNGVGESKNGSKSMISLDQLRSRAQTETDGETVNELLDRLLSLIYEIDENESLKKKMLPILKQLREAIRSTLEEEKDDEDEKKASDEEELDEKTDDESIYGLIENTAKHLTKNLRENLHELLFDINFGYFDEKIRKTINDFLEGGKDAESVTELLRNDMDSIRIKMVINEIERMQKKVKNTLQNLSNIHDSDVIKVLESLKMGDQITDEQFKRMAMADNDLSSFAKAMQGSGLWLARR